MLQNHYLRITSYKGSSIWDKNLSIIESLVLNLTSDESARSLPDIMREFELYIQKNPDSRNIRLDKNNCRALLDDLISQGFIRKITYKQLSKCL